MKRVSYRAGVEWVALNDDPGVTDPEAVASTISVGLLADLFDKPVEEVARAVVAKRKKERG